LTIIIQELVELNYFYI